MKNAKKSFFISEKNKKKYLKCPALQVAVLSEVPPAVLRCQNFTFGLSSAHLWLYLIYYNKKTLTNQFLTCYQLFFYNDDGRQ